MLKIALSREEAIHKYLHLVKYVAGRISVGLPAHVEINDLINDGVFGLIDAIEKYDDSRSVKFETYAITRINGAILDALRSFDWVPRGVRRDVRVFDRAYESLESELGRAPTDSELAERLELSKPEFDALRQRIGGTALVSLDESKLGDALEDDADVAGAIERNALREELRAAVESLPSHERTVIKRFYLNGEPLKAIKAELGVSESRISQIRAQAVTRLRARLRAAE